MRDPTDVPVLLDNMAPNNVHLALLVPFNLGATKGRCNNLSSLSQHMLGDAILPTS